MSFDPQHDPRYRYEEQDYAINIPLYLVLSLFTCFLFDLYWNYRQMQACNDLLGRDEFRYWLWLFLCIITLGLYHFYYQYQMGAAIVEIQERRGLPVSDGLPLMSVIAAIMGVGVVADCIHQLEINKIVR
jgi:hypothetical protein